MENVTYHFQVNSTKSQSILGLKLYTGYYIVHYPGTSKYMYSKFCTIHRLTAEDALNDAKALAEQSI